MSRVESGAVSRVTSGFRIAGLLAIAASAIVGAAGCRGAQAAAARDPMHCDESDPACARARASYSDCSQQCADNPECVDRCRGAQVDRMGHP